MRRTPTSVAAIRLVSTMAGVSCTTRAGLDATVRAGTKATIANETSVPTSRAKTGRARTDIATVYDTAYIDSICWMFLANKAAIMGPTLTPYVTPLHRDSQVQLVPFLTL